MIQLRLDAAALALLFPEGSEARVKLQHAVVEEFSRHYIKGVIKAQTIDPIATAVAAECQKQALKEVSEMIGIFVKDWPRSFTLNPEFQTEIRAAVRQATEKYLADVTKATIESLELDKYIETKIRTSLNYNISAQVNTAVNEKMEAARKALG